jgi:tRNA threonylcarbamoyladenosine biosynthesis protein TsaB
VHISLGPGSFTGLRIAVALAKAMHLANAVRIVTVDSLDVVAANASEALADGSSLQEVAMPGRIVTLFDAKRGQFYAAAYERILPSPDEHKSPEEEPPYQIPAPGNAVWRKIVPDCLVTASEILGRLAAPDRIGLLGDGLLYQRDKFDTDRTVILPPQYWSPRAAGVHLLGWQKARAGRFADPLTLTPFYLRGPQVTLRKGS